MFVSGISYFLSLLIGLGGERDRSLLFLLDFSSASLFLILR